MKRIEVTQSGKRMKKGLNLLGESENLYDALLNAENSICICRSYPNNSEIREKGQVLKNWQYI